MCCKCAVHEQISVCQQQWEFHCLSHSMCRHYSQHELRVKHQTRCELSLFAKLSYDSISDSVFYICWLHGDYLVALCSSSVVGLFGGAGCLFSQELAQTKTPGTRRDMLVASKTELQRLEEPTVFRFPEVSPPLRQGESPAGGVTPDQVRRMCFSRENATFPSSGIPSACFEFVTRF